MKIGVIGFGNMASAMIYGLYEYGNYTDDVYVSAKNYNKLESSIKDSRIKPCQTNEEVVKQSDFIIFAVKPYFLEDTLTPLRELLKNKCIYSVIASYDFDHFKELVDESTRLLVSVPNTPIRVGKGVIICDEKTDFTGNEKRFFEDTFKPIALIEYVPSSLLSIGGTITGCSPAFIDLFMEGLSDAAVMHGIPRELSYKLIASMIEGSARLQIETGLHPGVLKDQVCSPKGSTIRGVVALEKNGLRYALMDAVNQIQNP